MSDRESDENPQGFLEMSVRHLCTTKTKLRKVLEFCDTDITARTLGETHVSTDDLT